MLIVICGGDGSGKSCVSAAIAERLDCGMISFPNDQGYTGPMIRAYLRKEWGVTQSLATSPVDLFACDVVEPLMVRSDLMGLKASGANLGALAFQALQVANRMEVMPMLFDAANDKVDVVCARYWQSGYVYGKLDGLDTVWLKQVHKSMAQPHVNLLLDLPVEVAMKRRADRDGALSPERYEGRIDFATKVAQGYRDLWDWQDRYGEDKADWVTIDASQPLANVIDTCWEVVKRSPHCF